MQELVLGSKDPNTNSILGPAHALRYLDSREIPIYPKFLSILKTKLAYPNRKFHQLRMRKF